MARSYAPLSILTLGARRKCAGLYRNSTSVLNYSPTYPTPPLPPTWWRNPAFIITKASPASEIPPLPQPTIATIHPDLLSSHSLIHPPPPSTTTTTTTTKFHRSSIFQSSTTCRPTHLSNSSSDVCRVGSPFSLDSLPLLIPTRNPISALKGDLDLYPFIQHLVSPQQYLQPIVIMSSFFYGAHHHQQQQQHHPHNVASTHNHHGRSRRAPRLSAAQNPNRQYRTRPMKDVNIEAPNVTAFRVRFEAGRSFDLDDDLEFCPNLLTDDERLSIHSGSSDRSSLSSGSPDASPIQHQIHPQQQVTTAISLSSTAPSFVSPNFSTTNNQMKIHQPSAVRTRNAIPIVNPTTGMRIASPPSSISPGMMQQTTAARRW